MLEHLVKAELQEGLDGDSERDGADYVGRSRLLSVGQVGPDGVVPSDDPDRPATHHLGSPGEEVTRSDQHARAIRRVHLVAGERDEVKVTRVAWRTDVDA